MYLLEVVYGVAGYLVVGKLLVVGLVLWLLFT